MGCGRSSLKPSETVNTPPIVTNPDESKNGITFNENGNNVVVRFVRPLNTEPLVMKSYGYQLWDLEAMKYISANEDVKTIEGSNPNRTIIKGSYTPKIGNTYIFEMFAKIENPPSEKASLLEMRQVCGSGTTTITYKSGTRESFTNYVSIEGFSERSSLIPKDYATF
jgi:hypothetical protein